MRAFLPRELPEPLSALTDLALDLRWASSHQSDDLWRMLHRRLWEETRNPWLVLQEASPRRLEALADDPSFLERLKEVVAERGRYASHEFRRTDGRTPTVAYFTMEVGLGAALPLYAGGLGVLAGDFLKSASDLDVPLVGVSLLYQRGYFRQLLDAVGRQRELHPYNDPTSLPIQPVAGHDEGWLHVSVEVPGERLLLRAWKAKVGRISVYLLDSNDPRNSPACRGIVGELYGSGSEHRLVQEIVLGIGGWRLLEALGLAAEVCHLNEGHAAFVILERARTMMERHRLSFREALWAVRAGNVFTTHTPVAAGFDAFAPELMAKYFGGRGRYLDDLGISLSDLLALGRADPRDAGEPFNMAYLAMRGCARANGVSRLHGEVSRAIFAPLYARWPASEVPVGHVTNGIHPSTWDSRWADRLWRETSRSHDWHGRLEQLGGGLVWPDDGELWRHRCEARYDLVRYARKRLEQQRERHGEAPERVAEARGALGLDRLTIGFARRFTAYKRPNLLLRDPDRLARLLADARRPVQLIVAGKAHPADGEGKRMIEEWIAFVDRPDVRGRALFLEDYDIALGAELVRGVDLWVNTPRRPWEACGTSGMKVLVNGGLNLSSLDGWWAEAYEPDFGWAVGTGEVGGAGEEDAHDAGRLYDLLEREVVPDFYARDRVGVPARWVARMRASMSRLAPRFSSGRMVHEYLERYYQPAAGALRRRLVTGATLARELAAWEELLDAHWGDVGFERVDVARERGRWVFRIAVRAAGLDPDRVRVELFADARGAEPHRSYPMRRNGDSLYEAEVPASRPSEDYTPRIVPFHPEAEMPAELPRIYWLR